MGYKGNTFPESVTEVKKMKRLSAMLLAILMVLSLCACGSQGSSNVEVELPNNSKNGPSAVTIQKDITDELSRKNPYAVLTKIETVKSLTEDTSYEITLSVFAQTRYAESKIKQLFRSDLQHFT